MIKLPKMYTANSIKAMHEKLNLDAQTHQQVGDKHYYMIILMRFQIFMRCYL